MNIAEILKDCPKGTKLYCTMCGDVELDAVLLKVEDFQINVSSKRIGGKAFTFEGKYFNAPDAECLLFPSKDNRDWSTFVPPCKFKPFDRVVVRNKGRQWGIEFFSHMSKNDVYTCTGGVLWDECLPYNEETAKLIGTKKDYKG